MSKTRYIKGATYRFPFVDGHTEEVVYLGKNNRGMHRFLTPGTGEVWTGYNAPVSA